MKIVTEPPEGIKANMKSTISKLTDEDIDKCPHEGFKPLVFVTAFFHAII